MSKNSARGVAFVVESTYGTERLGLQILAAIAEEEGFDIRLYRLDSIDEAKLIQQMEETRPTVVAYSAMTYEHNALYSLNKKLKSEFRFISIFGGPHYTFNPEEIHAHRQIDIVCAGEGERAFRAFLRCVKNNEDYSSIPNLSVRCGNSVKENPVAPLIDDLDEVPFASRRIVPLDEKGHRHLGRTRAVMIGRGCPYQCTYCFNATYNQIYGRNSRRVVRWRSVENVISEIVAIKNTSTIDHFAIDDDAINLLPDDYIYEFCERYKREVSIPFSAQFRANLVDEDIIRALNNAGMRWVHCGIETGDEFVANNLLKRRVTNEQIINAFRIFNKYGIISLSQNMVGLPVKDPVGNALKTIALNIKARVRYAHFTILLPFPNTPIERYCTEHGYLPPGGSGQLRGITPSVFTKTTLRFPNPKDGKRVTNLHKFCSIAVRFPFLIPLIKLLIKLPPNRVFQYIYFFWYAYNRTVAPFKIKLSPSLILAGLKQVSNYLKHHD